MSKNVKNVKSIIQVFVFFTLNLLTDTFAVKQLHTYNIRLKRFIFD